MIPDLEVLRRGRHRLMVRMVDGDKREVECNCDSKFMAATMPEVGKAIRAKYARVPRHIPIFLFLDNAGGHGTDECVAKYVADLKKYFNIICIHQQPRSPATNMLDLGIWMALQSVVEKMHHGKRQHLKALCKTVTAAWGNLEEEKLKNVYERWKLVLDLIIADNGGDRLIESNRGKLFRAPSDETEDLEENDPAPPVDPEELTAAQIDNDDLGIA